MLTKARIFYLYLGAGAVNLLAECWTACATETRTMRKFCKDNAEVTNLEYNFGRFYAFPILASVLWPIRLASSVALLALGVKLNQ